MQNQFVIFNAYWHIFVALPPKLNRVIGDFELDASLAGKPAMLHHLSISIPIHAKHVHLATSSLIPKRGGR